MKTLVKNVLLACGIASVITWILNTIQLLTLSEEQYDRLFSEFMEKYYPEA